jgi:serine phosphatase RsbU (regulator of sigma subunit)
MRRKPKAFDIWKEMPASAIGKLALAVFLMFSVLGPLLILMESEIRLVPWSFVLIQTVCCGGLAGSIVLFGRKRWWVTVLIVFFWTGIIGLNSGGLSFVFSDEGFRVRLGNSVGVQEKKEKPVESLLIEPNSLDAIYEQRGILGTIAIVLLASGYAMFIQVVRREVKHRARLETEVKIAQDIQQSLLPRTAVNTSWCSVAGIAVPATEVGGDFFDIIKLSEDKVAIAIADVTGHGVGSGILSAMTKSALRSQIQHDDAPLNVLNNLNETIAQLSDEKTFVTFAYIVLDKSLQTIMYATAGHPPVFHYSRGSGLVTPLRTVNLALGLKKNVMFTTGQLPFVRGERLLLYTDGALETANPKGEQFGNERLQQFAGSHAEHPEKVCSLLIEELQKFSASSSFTDDVSVVSVQFL